MYQEVPPSNARLGKKRKVREDGVFLVDRFIPSPTGLDFSAEPSPQDDLSRQIVSTVYGPLNQRMLQYKTRAFVQTVEQSVPNILMKKKYSIEKVRILDGSGLLDDDGSNAFTWSNSKVLHVAMALEMDQEQIFSWRQLPDGEQILGATAPVEGDIAYSVAELDKDKVVSGWAGGFVKVHPVDFNQQDTVYSMSIHPTPYTVHAIKAIDSTMVMCGDSVGQLFGIDIRASRQVVVSLDANFGLQKSNVMALAYDNQFLFASGMQNGTIKIWDRRYLNRGAMRTYREHSSAVKGLAFDPNMNSYLLSGSKECHKLCLYHINSDRVKSHVDAEAPISGLHWFHQDPNFVVTSHADEECRLKLWRLSSTSKEMQLKYTHCINESNSITDVVDNKSLGLSGTEATDEFVVVMQDTIRFFKPVGIQSSEIKKHGFSFEQLSCTTAIR